MAHVIINVGTEQTYKKPNRMWTEFYDTERGAKIACTKLNKKYGDCGQWVVMTQEAYRTKFPIKMVERINLMSGHSYVEAEDTPLCCSPASETYWSM